MTMKVLFRGNVRFVLLGLVMLAVLAVPRPALGESSNGDADISDQLRSALEEACRKKITDLDIRVTRRRKLM